MALEDNLTGANRDAIVAVTNLFKSYGLETLAPKIIEYVTAGYGADVIGALLVETPEYTQRFSANTTRKAAGLPVLSPAEYLSTESAYRSVMSAAGLPVGFYDQPGDFTNWLANDTSPTEVQSRVNTANELVTNSDPATLAWFREHYTTGDLVAYALDQKRAAPLVAKQLAAAKLGGAAGNVGTRGTTKNFEDMADRGFNTQQVQQGFGFINDTLADTAKLSELYGDGPTRTDLTADVFEQGTGGAKKIRRLASKERAAFSGSGGQGKSSLTQSGAGQF